MKRKSISILILTCFFVFGFVYSPAQTSNLGLSFDGMDDVVHVSSKPSYVIGTGNFTLEAWVKVSASQSSNTPYILNLKGNGYTNSEVVVMVQTGKLCVKWQNSNLPPGTINIQDGQCHHIAVVRNNSTFYYYVDGVADGIFSNYGQNSIPVYKLFFGGDDEAVPPVFYTGIISEVRSWNVARTQAQIQASKNVFLTGSETGLLGYWRLNDAIGQALKDYAPLANYGQLGNLYYTTEYADPIFVNGCIGTCTPPNAVVTSAGTNICAGGFITLTAPSGTGYNYQWRRNGLAIANANAATYAAISSGTYSCLIGSSNCYTVSNSIVITSSSPNITVSGYGAYNVCAAASKTLTASSSNAGTSPTYAWKLAGVNIAGATSSTYTVTQAGVYSAAITNAQTGCTVISDPITMVSGLPAPSISPPYETISCNTIPFSTPIATGQTYQWKLNGNTIAGATNSSFTAGTSGFYTCDVTNVCGTGTSLGVSAVLKGTTEINAGGSTSFCSGSVALNATSFINGLFEWYNNGVLIPNTTGSTYYATTAGVYSCKITTAACGTKNSVNTITVNGPPAIMATGPITFCTGNVGLMALPTTGATYQWKLNGNNISGATSSTYTAASSGNYTCLITNAQCGAVTSNAITVTAGVVPPISITPTGFIDVCTQMPQLTAEPLVAGSYNWYGITPGLPDNFIQSGGNQLPSSNYMYSHIYATLVTTCGTSTSQPSIIRNMYNATIEEFSTSPNCDPSGFYMAVSQPNYSIAYSYFDTYQWRKNGVDIAGANSFQYYATSSGTYTCVISNSCGTLLINDSAVVVVTSAPDTTLTLNGPATMCTGGSLTMSVPAQAGATYKWYKNSIATAYTNSITVNAQGNYYCKIQLPCGSRDTRIVAVTVTQQLSNTITANGPATLCSGGTVTLQAATGTGYLYQWLKKGVAISGATQSTYTATASGDYSYTVSTAAGCSNTSSKLTVLTGLPSPVVSFSSNPACSGSTIELVYTVTNPATNLEWKFNNAVISPTLNNARYYYTFSQAGSVTLTATNSCGSLTSSPITVNVNPLPPASITAATSTAFCPGGSVVLNTPPTAGYAFAWINNNALIAGATAAGYTANATGNYACRVTNTATGCNANSNTIAVSSTGVYATTTPSGSIYKCTGQTQLLTANTGTGLTYQWRKNAVNISGATSSTYSATATGTYSVVVTGTCGSATSADVVIGFNSALPTETISPTSATLCTGSYVNLSLTNNAAYSYQWKLNGVATGGTTWYWTATVAGSYTCTITTSCGSTTTAAVNVVASPITSASITAGGPASFCTGGNVVLSANTGTAFQYAWYNNGVAITGATASTYTATAGGSYSCKIYTNGCDMNSNVINVNLTTSPTVVITPSGSTTVCSGTSVTLNATAGATTYQWIRNNVNLSGATQASFTTSTAGTYKVSITSACGNATSATVVVSVINNPTPTITASGPTTFCAGQSVTFTANTFTGVTYQWQKNSANITGATAQTYVAAVAGSYRVKETKSGCSKYSSKKTVTVNCRLGGDEEISSNEADEVTSMEVYPNPFADKLNIEITAPNTLQTEIKVMDVLGKVRYKQFINTNSLAELNLPLPAAIYMLATTVNGKSIVMRVVKTK